jgi:hypothetical protein
VGVRVNEAGNDRRAHGVERLVRVGRVGARTDPEHLIVIDHECGVVQSAERGLVAECGIVGRQFTDVDNDECAHAPSRMGTRSPVASAVSSAMS